MSEPLTYYERKTWTRIQGILDSCSLLVNASRWKKTDENEHALVIMLGCNSPADKIKKALDAMKLAFRNVFAYQGQAVSYDQTLKLSMPTIVAVFRKPKKIKMSIEAMSEIKNSIGVMLNDKKYPLHPENNFVQITKIEFERLKAVEEENKTLKKMNFELQKRLVELETKEVK